MPNEGSVQEAISALEGLWRELNFGQVLYILGLILACVIVSKILLVTAGKLLERGRLDKSLRHFIRSILRVLLAFLSILIVVDALGVPITSLVALFSLIGLALSLALQGLLSNLAGGIMVLWAKPFQTGDMVEIGEVKGRVKDVSLVYTKLLTTDNRLVYLTNKTVSEANVVNVTGEETRRVELTVSASYDSPVEEVKAAILEVIGSHPKTLADPPPLARAAQFGSSAVLYHVRAWCATGDYWEVYYDLNEGIKRAFDEKGLEMTYDHLNVHIQSGE